jgi:glutathione S-transferase
MTTTTLRIYHLPGARSVRPIWLCYELGLEIDVVAVDLTPSFRNGPEWGAISPTGKVPVLTDGALRLFESGAILDYILDAYGDGRLRPSCLAARAVHQQWCWFSEAAVLRPVGLNRLLRQGAGDIAAEATAKAKACVGVVEGALDGQPFLLGDEFSAADVMMGYSLALLESLGVLDRQDHPRACAYLARLQGRAAFRRAMSA